MSASAVDEAYGLAQQAKRTDAKRRATALKRYTELLDGGKKSDGAELLDVIKIIGVNVEDVEFHLAARQRVAEKSAAFIPAESLAALREKATSTFKELEDAKERFAAEIQRLQLAANQAGMESDGAEQRNASLAREIAGIQQTHPAAFGREATPVAVPEESAGYQVVLTPQSAPAPAPEESKVYGVTPDGVRPRGEYHVQPDVATMIMNAGGLAVEEPVIA